MLGLTFLFMDLANFKAVLIIRSVFPQHGDSRVFAYAVAVIEFVGGAAMILGFQTRLIGVLFAIVMIGAILQRKAVLVLQAAMSLRLPFCRFASCDSSRKRRVRVRQPITKARRTLFLKG